MSIVALVVHRSNQHSIDLICRTGRRNRCHIDKTCSQDGSGKALTKTEKPALKKGDCAPRRLQAVRTHAAISSSDCLSLAPKAPKGSAMILPFIRKPPQTWHRRRARNMEATTVQSLECQPEKAHDDGLDSESDSLVFPGSNRQFDGA